MSELAPGPSGIDPTSGSYVAALDPSEEVAEVLVAAARQRHLPRGVLIARPAAMRTQRRLAAVVVALPLLGTLVAVYQVLVYGVGPLELGILALMYSLCMLGAHAGLHRLFTHRSYRACQPVRIGLAILGSMAAQGPLVTWVAAHRRHHAYSDRPGDPHSPNLHGSGWKGLLQGLWHAHIGWMFSDEISDWSRFARDVMEDRTLFKIHQSYFTWVILGLLLPAALGGALAGSWIGAANGFLWGGLVRMFLVNNGSWAVGSICHVFGTRPFNNRDHSANNYLVAVLTFGEGLQNNHHAFPSSAAHALTWWQPDLSMWFIRLLQGLGLVWDVKLPSRRMIEEAHVKPLEARQV
ncbi:MAG TPA: acyl-CoA desaturase [Gemmataceae bacterium]|jgi:stearoyl-CoA desaturase (delta-9 desaturase)